MIMHISTSFMHKRVQLACTTVRRFVESKYGNRALIMQECTYILILSEPCYKQVCEEDIHNSYTSTYTAHTQAHTLTIHKHIHCSYTSTYTAHTQAHTMLIHKHIRCSYMSTYAGHTQAHTLVIHKRVRFLYTKIYVDNAD